MTVTNGSMRAVLYARVSSKDQEREGFSIPAQPKLLRQYAREQHLTIVREFVDVETAKHSGRGGFGEMIAALSADPGERIIELLKGAGMVYKTQDSAEQRRLLESVLPNCTFDRGSVCPTCKKPFDLFVRGNETGDWRGRRDSNSRRFVLRPTLPTRGTG